MRAVKPPLGQINAGSATSYVQLVVSAAAPSCARRHTRGVLDTWGFKGKIIETAELVVSELVTNAVKFTATAAVLARYADSAGVLRIWLALKQERGLLTIDVLDWDTNSPIPVTPQPYAEGGRCLLLVEALSRELSCFCLVSGDKVVRCVIEE